ncbi:MAG TPA: hypothetical protein VF059_07900 [Casimicrobiaceae bacterium]
MARDDVVVAEARERTRAAHLDDDNRRRWIDAKHRSPFGRRAKVRRLRKALRLQQLPLRPLGGLRRAGAQEQDSRCERQHPAERTPMGPVQRTPIDPAPARRA